MGRFRKLLDIKEGEGKPAVILFAYFFFFGATLTAGKIARDTYIFYRFDKTYLPLMFLLAAGVVAIIAVINYFASKRIDLVKNLFGAITLSGLFFAASLIFIQNNLNGLMIPFLYVWIDVITIIINFQFVVYASMVFNSRQARRLFGFILCGSPIARILVGAGIKPFVNVFGSGCLLNLAAVFILCCVMMASIARPYINRIQPVYKVQTDTLKNNSHLESYLKMLAVAAGAAAVATVIIEYQFLIFSDKGFPSEALLQSFFGAFYSITGVIALFTQLILTRWILARFGILSAMRILPAGLGIGAVAMLFHPSLFSALIGRTSEQITKFSLNKTSFDLLWVPVSPEQKQRKKLFIDDVIKTGMQGLAGIFIFIFVKVWPLPHNTLMQLLSLVALIFLGIWLFTTFHLKKGYVSALASAVEKRHLDFKQMRIDTTDSEIVKTIEEALNSNEEAKQVFALELISDLTLNPWADTLRKLFTNGTPSVREKILTMTADYPDIISNADIRKTVEEHGDLAGDALIIAGKRNMKELIPVMEDILENYSPENNRLPAAAATALLIMKNDKFDAARFAMEKLLRSEDENQKTIALRMLQHIPDFLTGTQLGDCCLTNSSRVCSAALDIVHHRYDKGLIPCIINCLKHPQTRHAARKALEIYPPGDVAFYLNETLIRRDINIDHKIEIIRTLTDYPDSLAVSILVRMLRHPSINMQSECIDALLKIARKNPLPAGVLQKVNSESLNIAKRIYSFYKMMRLIEGGRGGALLYDFYASGIDQLIPMLIKLLVLPVPETSVETYIPYKKYKYGSGSDNLIEIIDNILPRRESVYVIPLLQDISVKDRCRAGRYFFDGLPKELDAELTGLIQSHNEYQSVIGLDYAISQCRMKVLEQIDWEAFSGQAGVHHEIISGYVTENHDVFFKLPQFPVSKFQKPLKELHMLSILEKTIILRGMNLFEGVPGEDVYHVAQVMKEERLEKGALLFQRGDKGEYFYIVVTGEVLIHIGETELNRHNKGEYFGEMALLDDCPRSSSATALEETLLLKINQDDFLDIMMNHREVRRSIMRILNERFRILTDKYAGTDYPEVKII